MEASMDQDERRKLGKGNSRMIRWFVTAGLAVTLGCGSADGAGGPGDFGEGGTAGLGEGGTAGDGGPGTLQLVQTVPAELADEVPTDIVVTAEFDSALNEATVTTSSFELRRDEGASVEGSVSVDGPMVSFTPSRPLGLLSSYTATVTTEIESVSGETLDTTESWTFRTRDGQWEEPVLIEISNAGVARRPQVALDPNGNAVAVWDQSDGTRINIWSNRFTPTTGWGVAELIEMDDAGSAFGPQVAVDPDGNAVAVWFQSDGTRRNIWSNRFTPTAGWGAAELIEMDDAGDAQEPQVAVDPDGNAVAVWYQFDGTRANIWSNRFTPVAGWGAAEQIETDEGDGFFPQVALDPNGNAIAVWFQSDGTRRNIWSNRFTPTAGWGAAELIEMDDAGDAVDPQVAVDPDGNAVAVWYQSDGTRTNIWSNRFTPAAGWGAAEQIETDEGDGFFPQVALDPNGNAIAVWRQNDGTRANIWSNRFTPTAGWGAAEQIETDEGDGFFPQVALDPNGNAIAVWRQDDGTRANIWFNRFAPTAGWGAAELIETDNSDNASEPQVALDRRGNAIAVWTQSDGTRPNIYANRFE
jgi:hypothetical protein